MIEEKDIIEVGKFYRTHALKGELNAMTDGYKSELLDAEAPLIIEMEGIYVPFYVESWRPKGTFACLVKLEDINTQESAQLFVNKIIYMMRKDVAEALDIPVDELEIEEDFEGFRVEVKGVGIIGTVEEIDSSTDNLLMVVKPDDSDERIYIPFVDDFILSVEYGSEDENSEGNGGENIITLELPDGILELNKKE